MKIATPIIGLLVNWKGDRGVGVSAQTLQNIFEARNSSGSSLLLPLLTLGS